ncbi:ArnT family glycosyltransferase [Thermogemmatispora carboxidivorans]|uniref:ArnT family glycosyltransferase n=1 Tax=Thermogemmatispora carboxidivorans TaxID=1382306 RepID=UPI00138DF821|nr:glycosyltransferase family 39 protein [Thermogemmatispora carboxidivorans]
MVSQPQGRPERRRPWGSWSWLLKPEVPGLLLLASALRLYGLNRTEFDDDQATLFRMAYDAVHQGLLPVTSNTGSIGAQHPPGVVYLFMLPAALSANPLWAAVLVALLNVLAVLFTYFFLYRYYGRLAAVTGSFLYASAVLPVKYARFIWQPNVAAPFVVLFLLALFRGAVERRQGWFAWAVLWLALLYQAHEVNLLLAAPLLLCLILAPKTVRWRDALFALLILLLVFAPSLLWLLVSGLHDLRSTLSFSNHQAGGLSLQALRIYRLFIIPYDQLPNRSDAILLPLHRLFSWLKLAMPALLILAALWLLVVIVRRRADSTAEQAEVQEAARPGRWWLRLREGWESWSADGQRCGALILLVWQLVPLLVFLRYGGELHTQYLLLLMPGPFLLIGIAVAQCCQWLYRREGWLQRLRLAGYLLVGLLVVAQSLASAVSVLDTLAGHFNDRSFQPYPYHNDLASLQQALAATDQLAQREHLSRAYITVDDATRTAVFFLSRQMRTPATLFDADCLLLPAERAVMLVGPYDPWVTALLERFTHATLVSKLPRPGGLPFSLYVIEPATQGTTSVQATPWKLGDLQALSQQAASLTLADRSQATTWLVSPWQVMQNAQPVLNTTYVYRFVATAEAPSSQSLKTTCTFNRLQAGERLLVTFSLADRQEVPTSLLLRIWSSRIVFYMPNYGPLHLETSISKEIDVHLLQTAKGLSQFLLSVSEGTRG